MSTRLRTRVQSGRIFLLSGFSDDSRKEFGKKIEKLGAVVLNIDYFRSNCTHVVCRQLTRSEKYLGACATGKWLLHPDYIIDSLEGKQWLSEEKYEWHHYSCSSDLFCMNNAPRRWRTRIHNTQINAFSGWKVAVVVGSQKSIVYKRLLVSGGAEVYNIKLPVKNPEKVANFLTYLFVSNTNASIVAPLQDYGVLCLKPSYIGDYLIQNPPPDPFKYIVSSAETEDSQSQCDLQSTQNKITSDLQSSCDNSNTSLPTGSSHSTPDCLLPDHVLKNRLGGNSSCDLDENQETPIIQPSQSTASKRKLFDDSDLEWSYREVKKRKFHHVPYNWKPSVFCISSYNVGSQKPDTVKGTCQLSGQLTRIIQICMEERFDHPALDLTLSCLSAKFCPQAQTLHTIVTSVLQPAKTQILAYKAFDILMKVLHLHPPVNPILHNLYLEVLRYPVTHSADTENQGDEWAFMFHVVESVLNLNEKTIDVFSQSQENNLLLLQFLLAILEQNFHHFLLRIMKDEKSKVVLHGCMFAKILWFPKYQVQMNGRCKELLRLLSRSLESNIPQVQKNQLIKLMLGLISMATVICSIAEVAVKEDRLFFFKSRTAEVFIHECARIIQHAALNREELRHSLSCLRPTWFCLAVCQQILHTLDDYLVPGNNPTDSISLRVIVSRYFFLMPKLKNSKDLNTASPSSKERIEKSKNKLNKRNYKGETAIHIACIRNDVTKLEESLATPGIDVNIKDNAGWTPLHEACNHGNLKCVMRLLDFVPAKTTNPDLDKVCKKADLLAVSFNGFTPLHDAVFNNKLEICELLLQHGGHEQIEAKTVLGYTPLDLARTPEMRSLLSFHNSTAKSNTLSTDTECKSRQKKVEDIKSPSDDLYGKILGFGRKQLYTDWEDCAKYIDIISFTLRSYVECTDIIRLKDSLGPEAMDAFVCPSENILHDDLYILRDILKYIEAFRTHLLKISSKVDITLIDGYCKFLRCLMRS